MPALRAHSFCPGSWITFWNKSGVLRRWLFHSVSLFLWVISQIISAWITKILSLDQISGSQQVRHCFPCKTFFEVNQCCWNKARAIIYDYFVHFPNINHHHPWIFPCISLWTLEAMTCLSSSKVFILVLVFIGEINSNIKNRDVIMSR